MTEVYVNQIPESDPPSQVITGVITSKKNKKGTRKFKKDKEGQEYTILSCSEPSKWQMEVNGQTKEFVTYYLKLEDPLGMTGTNDRMRQEGGTNNTSQRLTDLEKAVGILKREVQELKGSTPDEEPEVDSIPF